MRLIIEVRDGCLYSVYGDPTPEGVELDVVLRDMDSINEGDEDPCPEVWDDVVYYW